MSCTKKHHRPSERYGSGPCALHRAILAFGEIGDWRSHNPGGCPMANYRFYRLDKDDHVTEPPHIFEGPDDDAAVEQAVQLLNEQVIEVWDHSRLVSRLEPDKGLDPTFVSPAATKGICAAISKVTPRVARQRQVRLAELRIGHIIRHSIYGSQTCMRGRCATSIFSRFGHGRASNTPAPPPNGGW